MNNYHLELRSIIIIIYIIEMSSREMLIVKNKQMIWFNKCRSMLMREIETFINTGFVKSVMMLSRLERTTVKSVSSVSCEWTIIALG